MVYEQIVSELQGSKLIVVSKYRTLQQLQYFYDKGHRDFAENRVQELLVKYESMPKDIHWHMIGHLQSNKVKYIVPFISMIHSVDSISLLNKIEQEAKKVNRVIDVCLQFNLALEESKSGFLLSDWEDVMKHSQQLDYVRVCGIMVMGPHVDDENEIARVFAMAKELLDTIQKNYPSVQELSMGMSDDYKIALKNGSTMIRVGSILFENV